ncbi:MAG: ATP-binding protein [Thermodesulfobacteriota bacterium]|nr:ATP-binding protein [Thermodesulfobacteriota bacterium]
MKLFLGVQGKFIIIASLFISLFAGIFGYLIINREKKLYTEDTIHQAKMIAEISGVIFTNALVYKELGLVDNVGLTDYLDYYVSDIISKEKRILYLVVLDPHGKVLSHSDIREYGKIYADPVTAESLRAVEITVQRLKNFHGIEIIDVAAPLKISTKSWGVCRIGFSLEEVNEGVHALRNEILSMVSLMLLGALVVIGIGGRAFATPLINLAKTMDLITEKGDLGVHYHIPDYRNDEIGRLQASFSWMIDKLRKADREKVKTMELMCQTDKMVTVGNLAAGVAHEINNPLGGVILCFNNLSKGDIDEKARKTHIEVIKSGLLKIQNTVQGLLDFARKTPIVIVPSSICTILDECLKLVDTLLIKQKIKVHRESCSGMPLIPVDPAKIGQVFLNIIINAIHAMAEGGELFLAVTKEEDMCFLAITDTGTGIDSQVLPRIFDPFFTTKDPGEGTGLGLAVCKSIIEQHGGGIKVKSEEGRGTKFIIHLPLSEPEKR